MNRSGGLAALALAAAALTGCTTASSLQTTPAGPNGPALPTPNSPAAPAFYNLATDLFFVALPPGSTRTGQKCPRPASAQGGGDCSIDFTSTLPAQDVYADFARRAAQTGWMPEQKDRYGRTTSWTKTFSDGSSAHVLLSAANPEKASPPYLYSIQGSV